MMEGLIVRRCCGHWQVLNVTEAEAMAEEKKQCDYCYFRRIALIKQEMIRQGRINSPTLAGWQGYKVKMV